MDGRHGEYRRFCIILRLPFKLEKGFLRKNIVAVLFFRISLCTFPPSKYKTSTSYIYDH